MALQYSIVTEWAGVPENSGPEDFTLKTYFLNVAQKRSVSLCLHKFSFQGLQSQSWGTRLPSQERLAHGSRCQQTFLSTQTRDEGHLAREQSPITRLLGSKQGAEPSPETQDVSARIARHDLAENLHPHHHEVLFPCHHGFSGASHPGLPSQLPTQRAPHGLPLSSRQPPPRLTTNEEPLRQHVWVSEMTPLSLLLSHCYWDGDARKTKNPLTEGVSSQGPRPTQPHSGLHLSQCS